MNTFFGLLIYAALCALVGSAAGFAWFLTTGTVDPPIWAVVASCIVIGVACDPLASALHRLLGGRGRRRRRAHARTSSGPVPARKNGVTP